MDYEKLGYTVIKMKYGDVGKYNMTWVSIILRTISL